MKTVAEARKFARMALDYADRKGSDALVMLHQAMTDLLRALDQQDDTRVFCPQCGKKTYRMVFCSDECEAAAEAEEGCALP